MWLRSRESMLDEGLVYDPIAASACRSCHLSPECQTSNLEQDQLLYASITQLCDEQISAFLKRYPDAWVLNVGAGLDTRFYRLDNGRCHWMELDVSEHLLWRQRLFHPSERYQLRCGSVTDLGWLQELSISDQVPLLIVCDAALLQCTEEQLGKFMVGLAKRFLHAQCCFVVAGNKTNTWLGKKLGNQQYAHGLKSPQESFFRWLPWAESVSLHSPLHNKRCLRWKPWQRWLAKLSHQAHAYTPVVLRMRW
ncbi:class I SAM-dependent methyltransferase [Vibrio sp. SCSIO 43136]|uniref:class I SAM-dependent methyltransferase n=1 Tax=Vibrio sp. SCSIO 43136 TaxID=2819101 RepID=UPI002074CB48|nr:class I SAM-dependent methyltransferase [Vibrio sp. SCSIO 43136]